VPSRAVGLPTYSGRGIDLGTGSVGETTPADNAERTGMVSGYLLAHLARVFRHGHGGAQVTGAGL
jgi:hypothetical protein